MKRRSVVAFAVLASVLVVGAPGASAVTAAPAGLAVASKHTDFGTGGETAPAVLENSSVVGSGDDARVRFFRGEITARDADNKQRETDARNGIVIEPQQDLRGVLAFGSGNTDGVTRAYLTDENGTVIKDVNTQLVGPVKFDANLQAGERYRLVVDAGGVAFYDVGINTAATVPTTGSVIDIVNGVDNGSTTSSEFRAFRTVQPITGPSTYRSANHSVTDAEGATVNLSTLNNASATLRVEAYDSGWTTLNSTTVSTGGNHSITFDPPDNDSIRVSVEANTTGVNPQLKIADETVLFNATTPTVDTASATPTGDVKTRPDAFEIDVSDPDFGTPQGDELTVEVYHKAPDASSFSSVGTDTVTSNSTVSAPTPDLVGGTHEWYVELNDSSGESTTTQTFSFNAPGTLEIRDVNTKDLVKNASGVQITFFGEDDTTVIERSTTNGTVDMTGLPADQEFVALVNAPDYETRTLHIRSLFSQQTIYLLNETATTSDVNFELTDRSGQFPATDETVLVIQRPINRGGNTAWRSVAGDRVGASGEIETTLERDVRYRIVVRRGLEERILGSFRPQSASRLVELEIGQLQFQLEEGETFGVGGRQDGDTLRFRFEDPTQTTDKLTVSFKTADGNQSLTNQTAVDLGNVTITETLNSSQESKTWVAVYEIDRAGETITGRLPLSSGRGSLALGIGLADEWKYRVSIGLIVIVGSLFSVASVRAGAIVVPAVGGVLFLLGWLPPAAGGIAVASSLALGVTYAAITGGRP